MSLSDILVVDDEDVVLSAIGRILSAHALHYRMAGSAEEAVRQIQSRTPEILLADIKLPGASGIELVSLCREQYSSMVSVCMTGYANTEHVLLSLESGAADFLPKPFTVDELISTITRARQLVGRAAGSRAPSGLFLLDGHSWGRVEEDGTLTLGLTDIFLRTIGPVEAVEVPASNTMLRQGGVLTHVKERGGTVYRAWCAFGGRVEQSNARLNADVGAVSSEPYGGGWIARVIPTSVEEEKARLENTWPPG